MERIQENQQYTTVSIEENVDMFAPRARVFIEQKEPVPNREKEYLERLRRLVVCVDDCLEQGKLTQLNDELNKVAKFILIQEGERVQPTPMTDSFMDFTGFTATKVRPKFGMNPLPEKSPARDNKRFVHLMYSKDVNSNRTNEESGVN